MDAQELRQRLTPHRDELARLGVEDLSVFGSVAQGDARPDSDVDLIVSFHGPTTFDRYMAVRFFLEDLLDAKVDLVTPQGVRPELADAVAGAIRVT